MAGFYGAALGGALQGYNQATAQQPENIMRMLQIQQAIRAQQIQNMNMQANARAMAGMQGSLPASNPTAPMIPPQAYGQVPPEYFGPQTPSPGQSSVPMQTPGGVGPHGIFPYLTTQAHVAAAQGSPVTNHTPIQQVEPPQSYSQPDQSTQGQQVPDAVKYYNEQLRKFHALDPASQQSIYAQNTLKTDASQAKMALDEQRLQDNANFRKDELGYRTRQEKRQENAGQSTLAKLADDYKAGRIDKANYEAGVIKANHVPSVRVSVGRLGGPSMGNYNQFSAQEERMLKPIEDAQRQSQEIRGLIDSNSEASMSQVQKVLSQYLQQGRMTNQMYGDNKSFGVVYTRASNAISRFATGDYNDKNKKIIREMVNSMDEKVFNPARDRIIKFNKDRLKMMGGNTSIADRPATFGEGNSKGMPTFSSQSQFDKAKADKTIKKGDRFKDPDGVIHEVE